MILSTTEFVPDRQIDKILGIARGSTVRSRNAARDLVAQLKNIIGCLLYTSPSPRDTG